MRKTIYFWMLAAAALAFNSCNKEAELGNSEEQITHVATISLGKAADTKTAVVEGEKEASYKWLDDDAQYLHVYENGTEGTIDSFVLNADKTVATLTVSFTGNPTAPYSYTAKYASGTTQNSPYNPKHPAEQDPIAGSFDPAADVLVSKATSDVTNLQKRASELTFTMGRIVTVNKMTLTGLEEGEVISSVEFTLSKVVNGSTSISKGDNGFNYNGTKKLTMRYDSTTGIVPSNGEFPVYFTAAPVDAAGIESVVVTTDQHVYTKSSSLDPNPFDGKTITFAIGIMTRFEMGMSGFGTDVSSKVKFYEVTSNSEIADGGEYLIVSSKATGDLVTMGAFNSGNYYDPVDVVETEDAVNGNYIEVTPETVTTITLEDTGSDGFYLVDSAGKYLYYTSNKNTLHRGEDSDKEPWTVETTGITLASASRHIQYNRNSPRFATYASGQTDIVLYYKEGSITVTPKLDAPTGVAATVNGDDITITWNDITAPDGQYITYKVKCTGESDQTVDQGVGTYTFEDLADGTYDVSVAALPSTGAYLESNAITVSDLVVSTTPAVSYDWVETAIGTLTSSDVFVIVGSGQYAMTNDNGTGSAPAVVAVTVSGTMLTGTIDDNIKWNISGNSTDGYTFYPNGDSETWLYCTATNNGVRVGTNSNSLFTQDADDYLVNTATSRYISVYNAQDWRCYGNTNNNPQPVKFYKRTVSDGKANAEVTLSYSGTVTYGDDPVSLNLNNPHNVTLSCASSNESVATVTDAGVATIVGAGTTTITASWSEQTISSTTYREGSVTYNLTVAKAAVTVAFSDPTTQVAVGLNVTNVATVTPSGLAITYSSSATGVATVTNAGVVTGVSNGVATITASYAGDNNHAASSDSYTITVGTANDGSTPAKAYTVAEALAVCAALEDNGETSEVYISGIISQTVSYNSNYHSATYYISGDGTQTSQLEVYGGLFVANTQFSSLDQISVSDEVIIFGKLKKYVDKNSNTTLEINTNNYIYSLNGITKVLAAGSLSTSTNDASKQITVTWEAATGTESIISYVVNCGGQSYNASAAGSHTFTMSDYGTYPVSVVASATDAISVTIDGGNVTLNDPQSTTKDYYKMVTSLSDITAGTYVIGALRSESATNNFYFGKASVSSGDWVVSNDYVTVAADGNGVRKFEVANLPAGAVEFTLTGDNTNGFTISNGSNYLYYTSANSRKLAFAAAGSSQKWKFVSKDSPLIAGGVCISAVGSGNYTISENSTAVGAIRGYASTTKYRAIYIFKKVNE